MIVFRRERIWIAFCRKKQVGRHGELLKPFGRNLVRLPLRGDIFRLRNVCFQRHDKKRVPFRAVDKDFFLRDGRAFPSNEVGKDKRSPIAVFVSAGA